MENTDKVLFEDDKPHWYIAMGESWVGPLAAADVYDRVVSGQISWAHFVWKPGQAEWKRICDVRTFQAAVPQTPAKKLQTEVKEVSNPRMRAQKAAAAAAQSKSSKAPETSKSATKSAKAEGDVRSWYLYYNDTQFGPFMSEEVLRFLSVGKITPRVHAWKSGMAGWIRLQELDEFDVKTPKAPKAPKITEQRTAPRRPMTARVLMHNNKAVVEAVCRDISVGGMQVLTAQIPGSVGAKIKLNVSSGSLDPFVAEGEIVRILEDRKGFSFRFNRLSDGAKKAIEKYIQS